MKNKATSLKSVITTASSRVLHRFLPLATAYAVKEVALKLLALIPRGKPRGFSLRNYKLIVLFLFCFLFIQTSCCVRSTGLVTSTTENKTSPTVEVFSLKKKQLEKKLHIPGELLPYESVDIFPKIEGFIQNIYVDKGSIVKNGQLLISLVAPELEEQITEAQAKLQSDEGTYQRLKAASETPGVISENELNIAQKAKEASSAHLKSLQSTKDYLQVRAPFNGVITERNVHTGALVGPSGAGASKPLLHIQKISRLRLVVPVPEYTVSGIKVGDKINFSVPAFPDKSFTAAISRIPQKIDTGTRTEQIELDVDNSRGILSPGMYPEVVWVVKRSEPTFFVPTSAIVTTTERTFVIEASNETAKWVNVMAGNFIENWVEVFGNLNEGDQIVYRASDELRDGSMINAKVISLEEGK